MPLTQTSKTGMMMMRRIVHKIMSMMMRKIESNCLAMTVSLGSVGRASSLAQKYYRMNINTV